MKEIVLHRKFWLLALFHVLLWTILPTVIRHALPMDANEGYMWGVNLSWGYDRDPWMNALLTRIAVDLGGLSGWLVYAMSQVFVVMAIWSVWRLGRYMFPPVYAFVAAWMLEGIQYYHLAAIDFNDNVLELGLWPVMALFLYQALKYEKLRYWLGLGVVAGLALMSKYYTIFPLAGMLLFLWIEPTARGQWRKPGLYIAAVVAVLISIPHIIWLSETNWVTIYYTQGRMTPDHSLWTGRFLPSLKFLFSQIGTFLGACVLLSFVYFWRTSDQEVISEHKRLSAFDRQFLWCIGIGPFVLTLILGVLLGWKVNTMWGTPLLSLWPLLVLHYWQPKMTAARLKGFIAGVVVIVSLIGGGYAYSLTKPGTVSSANYPARAISEYVESVWEKRYHTPLPYVAGDRYLASYVVYYADEPKPVPFIEWDKYSSHWLDEVDMLKRGAVFLLPVHGDPKGVRFPLGIHVAYPNLIVLPVKSFKWHRAVPGQAPVNILLGILPPR